VKLRSDMLRDWRIQLLILMDLGSLLVLLPVVTKSTTELTVEDVNSSLILMHVLESSYQNVTRLSSALNEGLWVHSFCFSVVTPRDNETMVSELKAKLSGMIPRGIPPDVLVLNGTLVHANVTATDRDCVVTLIEGSLGPKGKVIWVQSLGKSISITVNKRLNRAELEELLGTSARVVEFKTPRTLKTNLKFGIDFLGGFYYNVRPVGVTFTAKVEAGNVTQTLLGDFLNTTPTLTEEGEKGLLTFEIPTPGADSVLMDLAINDFFSTYANLREISFTFGNETSELVMNASNYDALEAVLNATFSVRYDVVGGSEASGVFEVEGKNSEADRTELEASLNKYLEILSFDSKVSGETMTEVEKMIESRADFMGVSDLRIKRAGEYIIVESPERIAGNSSVLEPLDFEARLWTSGNITVRAFTSEDVSRVDHYYFVSEAGGWAVPMTLRRSAAEKLRDLALTHGAIDADETVRRKHPLGMFFNGVEVYNASFSSDLAQSMREEYVVSFLAITGGPRENDEARKRAEDLYINLEASFPTKLRTAGEGQIPAMLGKDFARQVVSAAAAAVIGVLAIIYLRYRRPKLVVAVMGVSLSEVLILLGFSTLVGQYLDLGSVAGIVAAIGTGVDEQIVITDEALYQGEGKRRLVMSTRISRAFFVVFTAAATVIIAMAPLAYVGLGRLRGFAIMTIVGVLAGISITRPAYGRMVRYLVED